MALCKACNQTRAASVPFSITCDCGDKAGVCTPCFTTAAPVDVAAYARRVLGPGHDPVYHLADGEVRPLLRWWERPASRAVLRKVTAITLLIWRCLDEVPSGWPYAALDVSIKLALAYVILLM